VNEMEKFSEKVKKEIGYNKEVLIKFPQEVYEELINYSKENTNNCYWLAFKKLLFENKLLENYANLDRRVSIIETELFNEEPKNEMFISFGKKGE